MVHSVPPAWWPASRTNTYDYSRSGLCVSKQRVRVWGGLGNHTARQKYRNNYTLTAAGAEGRPKTGMRLTKDVVRFIKASVDIHTVRPSHYLNMLSITSYHNCLAPENVTFPYFEMSISQFPVTDDWFGEILVGCTVKDRTLIPGTRHFNQRRISIHICR